MPITFEPIGIVHTPHKALAGMPIQPTGAQGVKGHVEIFPEYNEGLKDLDGFSHLILLYYLHQVTEAKLTVTPFLDTIPRGVFSTRAPTRPNPIGLSVVELLAVEGNVLRIKNVDILDQTPLLDLKPYIPEFDQPTVTRLGWLENAKGEVQSKKSDDRFK